MLGSNVVELMSRRWHGNGSAAVELAGDSFPDAGADEVPVRVASGGVDTSHHDADTEAPAAVWIA
jgi:hypothetical protein